jgi:hypothetical protein
LAETLCAHGFKFTDPAKGFEVAEDVDSLIARFWQPSNLWSSKKPFTISPLYRVMIRVVPEEAPGIITVFGCDFWGLDHSVVTLGGLIDFEYQDQYPELQPFADSLKNLSISLYDRLEPSFAYVDKAEGTGRWIKEAIEVELKVLGWINIFGPPFVEKYGEDFLLNLPAYEVRQLKDGGIFHQLIPSIVVNSPSEVDKIQTEVELYCLKGGVKIKCSAPYYILRP